MVYSNKSSSVKQFERSLLFIAEVNCGGHPATSIAYELPVASFVTLKVYDVLGREVRVLVNQAQESGPRVVPIEARDLPSGVYLYRIQAGSFTQVRKMLLLK